VSEEGLNGANVVRVPEHGDRCSAAQVVGDDAAGDADVGAELVELDTKDARSALPSEAWRCVRSLSRSCQMKA
jgi:hypothetical protein